MKFKRPLIKLITVGSLFFMFSLSFTGVVSLSDDKANNFWTVKKLDISFMDSTYAESGGGESGGYDRDNERNDDRDDDNYRGNPSIPTTPSPTTPNNSNQTCKTVYDTVTTASGGTIQEPREVCTNNNITAPVKAPVKRTPVKRTPVKRTPVKRTPVKRTPVKRTPVKTISNTGLSNAEKNEIKSQFDAIYTKIVNISNNQSEIDSILNKISNIITKTIGAVKNKVNSINNIDLKNKYNKQLSILQELDTLVFDKTMGSNSIIGNILSAGIGFTPIKHVAPIGSTYTIIQSSNGKYTFQRANGTSTNKTWNTPEAVIAYIDKNAVPATVNRTPIARPKPIIVNKPKPIYRPKPVVRKPKPAPVYKPTPKPKPKPIPKPAPAPITTTTTAS